MPWRSSRSICRVMRSRRAPAPPRAGRRRRATDTRRARSPRPAPAAHFPGGVVGELAGELRGQAEGVLGAHAAIHNPMSSPGSSVAWRAMVRTWRCNGAKALRVVVRVRLRGARIPGPACAAPARSPRARGVPVRGECRHCPGHRSSAASDDRFAASRSRRRGGDALAEPAIGTAARGLGGGRIRACNCRSS